MVKLGQQGVSMPKVIDESKIFSAALDILVSHGYEGATTQKIAAVAEINEVTLFRKFGNKAGLFEKAIEHRFSDTPLNKLVYTGDLEADLLAMVKAYMETNEINGQIIPVLLIELPRNPGLQASFNTPWKNIQEIIKIVQKYQKRGVLKKEVPLASLSALIGPILVSQMFRRANPSLPTPIIEPQAHVDAFLNGRKLKK
jgi:AcrR family transcriptional regulator